MTAHLPRRLLLLLAVAAGAAACRTRPPLHPLPQAAAADEAPAPPPATKVIVAEPPRLAGDHCPDFAGVFERISRGVVAIYVPDPSSADSSHPIRIGTGFFIDVAGHVLTNAHVVHGTRRVKVRLWNNQEYDAEVRGQDTFTDLALLRVRSAPPVTPLDLGTSEDVRVGEWVMAVGTPFGLSHSVTVGVLSARHRWRVLIDQDEQYTNFIQTDAPIHPGNSGGPLLDADGKVIGISTALQQEAPGIGFALPIDVARALLPLLKRGVTLNRDWLGLHLPTEHGREYSSGIPIIDVREGAPAARVGLRPGDVLVAVNEQQLTRIPDLRLLMAAMSLGGDMRLEVRRGTDLLRARIRLIGPEEPARPVRKK